MNQSPKLLLTLTQRLLLLFFIFIIAYVMLGVVGYVLMTSMGMTTPATRIMAVAQDVLLFFLPAIATAVIVSRTPATLLAIDTKPQAMTTLLAVAVLVASVPLMNAIIDFNQNIQLPSHLEDIFRSMEENAEGFTKAIIGPHTITNLIMSILIVGIFAGVSEEILFRGCLQRLMSTGGVNIHVAIWVAAIVFSALHMQFYGFIPRMLLGAYFGYLLYWTGSLWVPVILHCCNNTMYLVEQYITGSDTSALGSNLLVVSISLVLTVFGLYLIRLNTLRNAKS